MVIYALLAPQVCFLGEHGRPDEGLSLVVCSDRVVDVEDRLDVGGAESVLGDDRI